MNYRAIALCGIAGGVGASVGYYLPDTVATGLVMGAVAVAFGAADFVIKDSLKLVDGRIERELQAPRSALRRVATLDCTRRTLLRLSLMAMLCKGLATAVGLLVTQGKATPVIMAVGGGALAFGAILTGVIYLSHEHLVTRANQEAVDRAEETAARNAVDRLGNIHAPAGAPERPIVATGPAVTGRPRKLARGK